MFREIQDQINARIEEVRSQKEAQRRKQAQQEHLQNRLRKRALGRTQAAAQQVQGTQLGGRRRVGAQTSQPGLLTTPSTMPSLLGDI